MANKKVIKVYVVTSQDGDVIGIFKSKPNRMKYLKTIGADDPEDDYFMDAQDWADCEIESNYLYP